MARQPVSRAQKHFDATRRVSQDTLVWKSGRESGDLPSLGAFHRRQYERMLVDRRLTGGRFAEKSYDRLSQQEIPYLMLVLDMV
jgi:hypothetical protein